MYKKTFIGLAAFLLLAGAGCVAKDTSGQQVTPTEPEQVFCTMDAKQCPDGSYVGRSGPNCEFAACPTESKPQTNQNLKEVIIGGIVSFQIPSHCIASTGTGSTYIVCPTPENETPIPEFSFSSDGTQVNMRRYENLESQYWRDTLASMKVVQPLTRKIQINIDQ